MCCGVDGQEEEETLDVETAAVLADQADEVTDVVVQEFEVGNLLDPLSVFPSTETTKYQ